MQADFLVLAHFLLAWSGSLDVWVTEPLFPWLIGSLGHRISGSLAQWLSVSLARWLLHWLTGCPSLAHSVTGLLHLCGLLETMSWLRFMYLFPPCFIYFTSVCSCQ